MTVRPPPHPNMRAMIHAIYDACELRLPGPAPPNMRAATHPTYDARELRLFGPPNPPPPRICGHGYTRSTMHAIYADVGSPHFFKGFRFSQGFWKNQHFTICICTWISKLREVILRPLEKKPSSVIFHQKKTVACHFAS